MKAFHYKNFDNWDLAFKAFKIAKRIYPNCHVFITNEIKVHFEENTKSQGNKNFSVVIDEVF